MILSATLIPPLKSNLGEASEPTNHENHHKSEKGTPCGGIHIDKNHEIIIETAVDKDERQSVIEVTETQVSENSTQGVGKPESSSDRSKEGEDIPFEASADMFKGEETSSKPTTVASRPTGSHYRAGTEALSKLLATLEVKFITGYIIIYVCVCYEKAYLLCDVYVFMYKCRFKYK